MFGIDDAIGGIANLAGTAMSINAQKQMAEWQNATEERKMEIERDLAQQGINLQAELQKQNAATEEARKAAYTERMGTAGAMGAAGETAFNKAASTPLPELEQAKKDVLSGQAAGMQQAAGQMKANLAQTGVRGGQAAGLLNRGTGEMGIQATKDINTMQLTEAEQRAAEQRAYEAAKAARAQGAQLTPTTGF